MAEAVAKIERINLAIARWEQGTKEMLREAEEKAEAAHEWIRRATAEKRQAEQVLRDAGAEPSRDGAVTRWFWRPPGGRIQMIIIDDGRGGSVDGREGGDDGEHWTQEG